MSDTSTAVRLLVHRIGWTGTARAIAADLGLDHPIGRGTVHRWYHAQSVPLPIYAEAIQRVAVECESSTRNAAASA